jgi:hypothetical protein
MRTLKVQQPLLADSDVKSFQKALNHRSRARKLPVIAEDGIYGQDTAARAAQIAWLLGIGSKPLDHMSAYVQRLVINPKLRNPIQRIRGRQRMKHFKPPSKPTHRFGIDYAWGRPNIAAFKAAGVTFVARYVSTPGNSKNISASEARTLSRGGLDIVLVFETTAQRATAGFSAGVRDARSARKQALAVGWPKGGVIYFAVDFDASGSAVDRYFDGVASVLGKDHCGPYAGVRVVEHLMNRGFKWAWQTYAWSGGRWDPRAQLQQYSNEHYIGGVNCDYNRAVKADFGQWRQ